MTLLSFAGRRRNLLRAAVVAVEAVVLAVSLWLSAHPAGQRWLREQGPAAAYVLEDGSRDARPAAMRRPRDGAEISAGTGLGSGDALVLEFAGPVTIDFLEVQADGNDTYDLASRLAGGTWAPLPFADRLPGFGLRTRRIAVDRPVTLDEVRITPRVGDGMYGVGAVLVGRRSPARTLLLTVVALLAGAALARTAWPSIRRRTPSFTTGLVLGLLGTAYLCVIVIVRDVRSHPGDSHPIWSGATLVGLACLVVAATLRAVVARLAARTRASGTPLDLSEIRHRVRWTDVAWWLAVVVLVAVFRLGYLVTGHIPAGLFFEEHEAAWVGRELLQGNTGAMAQFYNLAAIAVSYQLFGISDVALRVAASTMGALAALLFAATAWRLFPRSVAFFCAVALIAGFSVVTGSMSIEESYALVFLVQSAVLLSMLLYAARPTPARGIFLGVACAVPMTEYIAVKPGIVIGPAVALGVSAWLAVRAEPEAERRQRLRQWGVSALFFVAAFLLLATPMLFEIAGGGGQFFEGRGAAFVGAQRESVYATRWPRFGESLRTHVGLLFWRGLAGGINPRGVALLDPIVATLVPLSVLILGAYVLDALQRRRHRAPSTVLARLTAERGRGWRIALWWLWAAGATAFCALWNPEIVYENRLFVVIPVAILLAGEVLAAGRGLFRGRGYAGVVLALSVALVVLDGHRFLSVLDAPDFRMSFRSKTIQLCRHLDRRDPANRYALVWDWGDGLYFGDTPMAQWVTNQTGAGYDSWPCTREHAITPLPGLSDTPGVLTRAERDGRPFTHVIVGTRFKDNDELLTHGGSDFLDRRLDGYVRAVGPRVDPRTCSRFADSLWFRYAICPIGSGRAPDG